MGFDSSHDLVVSRSTRTELNGLVAVPAGDGVTLICAETDPAGGLLYSVEGGKQRMLQIGEEVSDVKLGIIDTARFLVLMEPGTHRLRAFCTLFGGSRIYFFGSKWGYWLDESGTQSKSPDMISRMKSHRVPVAFNIEGNELVFEINVNPHFREAFTQDTISAFDFRANSHQLQLAFDIPSGKFKRGKVLIQKERGHDASGASYGVRGFPLIWPTPTATPPPKTAPSPRPQAAPSAPPPPPRPSTAPTAAPAAATSDEPPRIKLAPRNPPAQPAATSAPPNDETASGRIKLRPKSDETGNTNSNPSPAQPAPSSSQGPQRASLRPRTSVPGSGEYREATRTPPPQDSDPPRIKLRPPGSGGFSRPDSGGFDRVNFQEPAPEPAQPAADEWIDDLLAAETRPNLQVPPTVAPPPQPAPGMQATKKGVLTIPVQQLPIEQLIERIENETDNEVRWKMIEQNLILGREERTYQLVARFAEPIHERTPAWPPARLKLAFGRIPGGILFGVMYHWKVNQIMAVAEENPETEKIMTWLRERELDRLLNLDTSNEVTTLEAARRDLCVDKNADEAAIKKTWRTLLSFLNADHGRQDERAIHRKKDEIAKHLQTARNVMLRLK